MKILLLFDLSFNPPKDQDYSEFKKSDDFVTERDVTDALEELGHTVKWFGFYDDLKPLIREFEESPPDVVFNLCESVYGERKYEPGLAALLELFKLRFTGAGSASLNLCKDKGLTKQILTYHRLKVPRFLVSKRSHPIRGLRRFQFPTFTKPLGLEASEGIAQVSFSESERDCLERVKYLHSQFDTDVIVEEYIEGREIYVSVIGNERLTVFPPRELFFDELSEGEPRFATFKAKWDDAYRKKWGIRSGQCKNLSEDVLKKIEDTCKKIYRLFGVRGYARVDLRLTPDNEVVFIEVNPNASIAKTEDFALSAKKAGWDYVQLIEKLIQLA